MTPLVFLLLAPDAQSKAIFDKAIELIKSADKGVFTAEFRSQQNATKKSGRYDVSYSRPGSLQLHSRVEGEDRTFTLLGDRLYGLDWKAQEWLSTKAGTKGSATQRLGAIVPIDEPVRIIVDPGVGANFLGIFKEIPSWKIDRDSSGTTLYAKDNTGGYTIGIQSDGRLKSVRVESAAGWLEWSYRYGGFPGPLRPPSTAGFKRVSQFVDVDTTDKHLPIFTDAASRAATLKAIRGYATLQHVAFTVSDNQGAVTVWASGKAVRQRSAKGEWAWDHGTLTLLQSALKIMRTGKANWRKVDTIVGKAGQRVDPFLSRLMRHENPITNLLGSDMRAHMVGSLSFGGAMCDVVEYRAPGLKLTLTIRQDTGLLYASMSEQMDAKGHAIGKSERRYTYISVGKPLPPATFAVKAPAGFKRHGL